MDTLILKNDWAEENKIYKIDKFVSGGILNLYKFTGTYERSLSCWIHCKENWSALQFAQKTQKVVSIELRESDSYDVKGMVTALDDHTVFIHQLTGDGAFDGDTVVLLEDITEVCCDSQSEQSVKLLSEHQDK